MSRIAPLSISELEANGIDLSPFLEDFEELPNSILTLGYLPDVLDAALNLWKAVVGSGSVAVELKFMVGHLASLAAGCTYCSAHTATKAAGFGVPIEKMQQIWDFERNDLFSERERAALRFGAAAGASPNAVSDENVAELRSWFDDREILELLAVIAMYGFFNRWNDSLATPLEPLPQETWHSIAAASLAQQEHTSPGLGLIARTDSHRS